MEEKEEKGGDSLNLKNNSTDVMIYSEREELLTNKFWDSLNQGINLLVGLYEGIQSACTATGIEQSDLFTEIRFDDKSGRNKNVNRNNGLIYGMNSNEISTSNSTRVSSLTNFNDFESGITTKSSSIQDLSYINIQNYNKDYILINNNNINNDPTIQLPHVDVPDLSTHTKMYATRSHISFTILCCQNVEKIIETSLICGDFKLKGPGFRVENVYIPIRNEKQSIELKLTTFNKDCKRNDLTVDIPLSAIHRINENYRFWLMLSSDKDQYSNEYNDILPEAVFRLKVDNENYKKGINKPRILVNLKRVMCGIIEDNQFSSNKNSEKFNYLNPKSSLIYVGLYTDSLDMELSQILNSNPTLLLNNNIERLNIGNGHYKINNIEVIISYGTGKFFNTLFVQDETSRQPLIDYLNNTNENIEWLTNEPSSATELVPQGILPDFTGTPAPWEVETDRRKAMELACHRVALREHIALQYLIDTGCTNLPQPKFSQWLNPPYFRIGPQYEPVPMSYNWGPNYTNIQLIPLEQPKKIN